MSAPHRRRTLIGVAAATAAIVLTMVAVLLVTSGADDGAPADDLKVDWADSEGHPGCVFDAASHTVEATLTITGESSGPQEVTVIVTAYADENTSQPVGSHSGSVQVDGTVDTVLRITIPVDATPHVGEDDVAACRREVEFSR